MNAREKNLRPRKMDVYLLVVKIDLQKLWHDEQRSEAGFEGAHTCIEIYVLFYAEPFFAT